MSKSYSTKRILVFGRVQGVGFRYSMFYAAQNLGIKGWVRNRRDGSVEAMAQGDEKSVEAFIAWAHKGPELSHVERVEVLEDSGDFAAFEIKDTL